MTDVHSQSYFFYSMELLAPVNFSRRIDLDMLIECEFGRVRVNRIVSDSNGVGTYIPVSCHKPVSESIIMHSDTMNLISFSFALI